MARTLKNPITWSMSELDEDTPQPKAWSKIPWGDWTDAESKWKQFAIFAAEARRDANVSTHKIPNKRRNLAAAVKNYMVSQLRFGTLMAPNTIVNVQIGKKDNSITVKISSTKKAKPSQKGTGRPRVKKQSEERLPGSKKKPQTPTRPTDKPFEVKMPVTLIAQTPPTVHLLRQYRTRRGAPQGTKSAGI